MLGVTAMACSALVAVSSDGGDTREVRLQEAFVVVGDVVECPYGLDANSSLMNTPLVNVNVGPEGRSMSNDQLADLLRRRIPGLGGLAAADFAEEVVFFSGAEVPRDDELDRKACSELNIAKDSGASIYRDDVSEVTCDSAKSRAPLTYDSASGLVRAAANLGVGDYLGQVMLAERYFAEDGDQLQLQISVGPVTIKRQVNALQPIGGHEDRSFVADGDGEVLLVPTRQLSNPQGEG